MGRPRRFLLSVTAATVLLGGCYDDSIYDDLLDLNAAYESDTTGSGSTSGYSSVTVTNTGPTSDGSDTATTSGTESASGSGGDGEGETKPQIALHVSPPVLTVAGHLSIAVEHTPDVDRIELFQGMDEEPVLMWDAGEAPPELLVTRGEFGEQRQFRARGYDADDNYAVSGEVFVELQLPKPGTLLFEENFAVGATGEARAVAAGAIAGEPQLLVAHDDDQSATVGRYTGLGMPQMKAPLSGAPLSVPTGVALDADEKIIAVGVDLVVDKEQAWVVRVDPHTAAVEKLFEGKLGEAATGCAVDPDSGRIYVSGYGPGKFGDAAHDAILWALSADGSMIWVKKWERSVPKDTDKGEPIDRASAVAVLDDGDPVIVGESRFKPKETPLEIWAFAHRYTPNGALTEDKSWTSASASFAASAHAVTRDRENGVLVAGWSQVIEGAPRQATVFAFGPLLEEAEIHTSEPSGDWTAKGVARLPTGDFVYASDFDDGLGRHDVEVRGIAGLFGEPAWTRVFAAEDVARVGALTLTRNAHIIVVGTRRAMGLNTMFIAALHP